MSDPEKTPHGDPIYRYEARENEFLKPVPEYSDMESITQHLEKHLGKIESVFHEVISDAVHIDVHWIKPSETFPFHILVTTGMSDLPMNTPEGVDGWNYAELCIFLPAEWDIRPGNDPADRDVFGDEKNYWPFRWLKMLARFPHQYNTWLSWGHTIPNGENASPIASNTSLGCMMLYPPVNLPLEFFQLHINDQKLVRFFNLVPLYKEEMEFKLHHGADALMDKFDESGISPIVDINRKNVCI